jgi:hypothetical protein
MASGLFYLYTRGSRGEHPAIPGIWAVYRGYRLQGPFSVGMILHYPSQERTLMRSTVETFGIIAWVILGVVPLHAEEGGIKPNWKETSFQLNDNVRLDVDGYAYIGPFYTNSPPAVSS